jgi:hypothetical protein
MTLACPIGTAANGAPAHATRNNATEAKCPSDEEVRNKAE